MGTMRWLTAGESHGKALIGIIEGIPAGLTLSGDDIDRELKRRQMGYGRGARMKIESDCAEILSGVRSGVTLGSPISIRIENKDWKNWQDRMAVEKIEPDPEPVTIPRPGHADLAGHLKYRHSDLRNVIERSSARETAARVGLGAIAKQLLRECRIEVSSHVIGIGGEKLRRNPEGLTARNINDLADASPVRCIDDEDGKSMVSAIDEAIRNKDSLGGVFEVVVDGLPAGLGSYAHWDRKLDARLTMAVMSIPAIKGVEIGPAFENSSRFGSEVHDEIELEHGKISRPTNRAGGLEGGVTNGMPLIVRGAMKPISTLRKPLKSVDLSNEQTVESRYERSDTCAVPAAAVIGEAMVALTLTGAVLEKYGGDSMEELLERIKT